VNGDGPGAVMKQTASTSMNPSSWRQSIEEILKRVGARQGQRCPFCGTPLAPDDLNCPGCGESLKGLLGLALHESYFREAHEQFAEGNGAEALETVALCLGLRPDYGPALRLKAGLLALKGRLEEAEAVIAGVQLITPHDTDTAALAGAIARGAQESREQDAVPQARRPARHPTHAGEYRDQHVAKVQIAQPWRVIFASVFAGAGLATLMHWISRYFARGKSDQAGS